jgi:hypothetical protein
VAIQYLSLQFPMNNSWVRFNSLQLLSYFVTIFVAAPLAIITGLRQGPRSLTGSACSDAFSIGRLRARSIFWCCLLHPLYLCARDDDFYHRSARQSELHVRRREQHREHRLNHIRRRDGDPRERLGGSHAAYAESRPPGPGNRTFPDWLAQRTLRVVGSQQSVHRNRHVASFLAQPYHAEL